MTPPPNTGRREREALERLAEADDEENGYFEHMGDVARFARAVLVDLANPDGRSQTEGEGQSQKISEAVIEAGARGRYEWHCRSAPDLKFCEWDELAPPSQEGYRSQAEAVFEAALGLIAGLPAAVANDPAPEAP